MQHIPDSFSGPSGRTLARDDMMLWYELQSFGVFRWSPREVRIGSGLTSHIHYDDHKLSQHPELLHTAALLTLIRADGLRIPSNIQRCLIGIPGGGYALAQTAANITLTDNVTGPFGCKELSRVRELHKNEDRYISPADTKHHAYVTVSSRLVTGRSAMSSFRKLEKEGYPTKSMRHVFFLNWALGGTEALTKAGYKNTEWVFDVRDIVAAFVRNKWWPLDRYKYLTHMRSKYG